MARDNLQPPLCLHDCRNGSEKSNGTKQKHSGGAHIHTGNAAAFPPPTSASAATDLHVGSPGFAQVGQAACPLLAVMSRVLGIAKLKRMACAAGGMNKRGQPAA